MTGEKTSTNDGRPSLAYAWFMVGLLTLAYTLSFVDRQILSLLIGPLKSDLGISDVQISLLQGLAFALFYTMMGIPSGRLVDTFNRKWIIAIGITLWSLMTFFCGVARTYAQLFLARMGVGIGEATLNPSAYSVISDYFPKEKLGAALGVYAVGIYLGAGMAFILGGAVIDYVQLTFGHTIQLTQSISLRSWQVCFIIVGAPGFILAAVILLAMREPARTGVLRQNGEDPVKSSFRDGLAFIWNHRKTFGPLYLGITMMSPLGYIILSWGPEFFIRTYGISNADTGYVFGLIVLVFGGLGIVAGGIIADKLVARGDRTAYFKVVALASIFLVPLVILMPLAGNKTVSFVLLAPVIFFSAAPYSCLPAALQAITPNQMRGQISAIYMLISNITGIAIGPYIVAFITDNVFQSEASLKYSIAIACGVAAPLSAVFFRMGYAGLRESLMQADAT